jgi:hypothetical protein
MASYVLLDVVKIEHAVRIREAERARLVATAERANERPSRLKSLLLTLKRG